MQTKLITLALPMGLLLAGITACKDDAQQPPPQYPQQQYPQQQYPQQQYPQQQYPQQQYPQQQYPQTQPTATTTAPQGQTATAIPGVMKNADGTCSVTLPSMTGQPSAPIVGACPPGI